MYHSSLFLVKRECAKNKPRNCAIYTKKGRAGARPEKFSAYA